MCLSAPPFSLLTLLTSDLAHLNPIPQTSHLPRVSPDPIEVSEYPFLAQSALAFDFAVGEVIWLGVPGPS